MQSEIRVKLWSWGHGPAADEDFKSLEFVQLTLRSNHVKWALFLHVNSLTCMYNVANNLLLLLNIH